MVEVDLQPKDRRGGLVGTDETQDRPLRALAHVVAALRSDWSEASVLTVLRSDRRSLHVLATVAVHAAADPSAKTPGVIPRRAPCTATATDTLTPPAVRPGELYPRPDSCTDPTDTWRQARQAMRSEP